jgi:hypothetical protein
MAEIKVEKKEGTPWLMWLLGALALIAIIYFATRGGDERDDGTTDMSPDTTAGSAQYGREAGDAARGAAAGDAASGATADTVGTGSVALPGAATTGANDAGGSITDVATVAGATDRKAMVNRAVDLTSAEVVRVVSDRGFTVGSGGNELFVMLDDKLNDGGAEKSVAVKQGQRVKLTGTLMEPPTAETKEERYRGLSEKESSELRAHDVYLHATAIDQAQ